MEWQPIYKVVEHLYWPMLCYDEKAKGYITVTWYRYDPNQKWGGFDSYQSALAHQSGYWKEYCEFHRLKR